MPEHVDLLGSTQPLVALPPPKRFHPPSFAPVCIGQKQRWFLLRVRCRKAISAFDSCDKPEFDSWRWVQYWQPVREVIYFKRRVCERALEELAPLLFPDGARHVPRPVFASASSGAESLTRYFEEVTVDSPRSVPENLSMLDTLHRIVKEVNAAPISKRSWA